MSPVKLILAIASVMGALSVSIGAFGAHKFAPYLESIKRTETFETAVKYQFYHTFAMLIAGLLLHFFQHKMFQYSAFCYLGGIVIFSGSLYILCATNVRYWGAVTPIGGVLFIAGWICMLFGLFKTNL